MCTGGNRSWIARERNRARIRGFPEAERQTRSVAGTNRLDAALRIFQTILRLTLGVVVNPLAPTGLAMRGRDVLVEIQSIAVLESKIAFVDELHTRATCRCPQPSSCCCGSQEEGHLRPSQRGDKQSALRVPAFASNCNSRSPCSSGRIATGTHSRRQGT